GSEELQRDVQQTLSRLSCSSSSSSSNSKGLLNYSLGRPQD
ncbi:hypothetical protein ETH_00018410, partial [Eimeria tenella]